MKINLIEMRDADTMKPIATQNFQLELSLNKTDIKMLNSNKELFEAFNNFESSIKITSEEVK